MFWHSEKFISHNTLAIILPILLMRKVKLVEWVMTGFLHWGLSLHSHLSEAIYHPAPVLVELPRPEQIHLYLLGSEGFGGSDSSSLLEDSELPLPFVAAWFAEVLRNLSLPLWERFAYGINSRTVFPATQSEMLAMKGRVLFGMS